ncbi:alpha/beta fold hydrolase [Membranihabitans maritimus]|uniref:alpha/beta fold hydrolase n=1 Tax=Membranihabitans maritimus TaxID=2904244 RepID=UPI001F184C46|nr:alpha/beta hydrolase [Membranihabitans maritimus]
MNNGVINTKLGDIEYSSIGKGIPIVFVHGGHSNCNETLCIKGFDLEKFQLIIPSRPGYGKTPLNGNRTPKQAADLTIELANHLSIDNVIIYGISAGGLTAIELASNYPDRVSKMILASAISKEWLDKQGKIYKTSKKMFNPRMEKIVWGMVRFFSRIFPNMIEKSFYPKFSNNPSHKLKKDDVTELISTIRHYNSKTGFLNNIDQNIDDEVISKIKCPTLIIHSENDSSVPFEHALHANKMIKNSEIAKLNNEWGHLFWIGTDSIESITKTIEFIKRNSSTHKTYKQ